jgi:predicted O-methyltransferase YrrM
MQALRPDDIDRVTDGIPGWLGPQEGRLLYTLAAAADPAGRIVEIGSWHGRSTIWLAAGAASGRGARVTAIDPHRGTSLREEGEDTEPLLRANLARAGVADGVDVVVATSAEAAAGFEHAVSLLWIDGDHSYEEATRDLALWEPRLLPGAAVALHDTFVLPGPERVVRDRLVRSRRYSGFVHAETTTAARLAGDLTATERVERRVSLLRRSLYGARLRAYDRNVLGYARVRDAIGRRTGSR